MVAKGFETHRTVSCDKWLEISSRGRLSFDLLYNDDKKTIPESSDPFSTLPPSTILSNHQKKKKKYPVKIKPFFSDFLRVRSRGKS